MTHARQIVSVLLLLSMAASFSLAQERQVRLGAGALAIPDDLGSKTSRLPHPVIGGVFASYQLY